MSEPKLKQVQNKNETAKAQQVEKQQVEQVETAVSVHPTLQRALADPDDITPNDAKILQRTFGNQAVRRFVLQRKMTVGPVGDKYEQEADAVAKQVVQTINTPTAPPVQRQEEEDELQLKPFPSAISLPIISTLQREWKPARPNLPLFPFLQRQEEDEELQAKGDSMLTGGDLSGDLESSVQQAKSGGQPLGDGVRGSMEQAFNADFSSVKVHTDTQSDTLNRSISARAFTTGPDIFFRGGEYNPASSAGKTLLAHELTHTIQQGAAPALRRQVDDMAVVQRQEDEDELAQMKPQSHQLNQSIQAKAFTTGKDVFFRQGAYQPGSRGGQGLITRELTHVVPQINPSPLAKAIQRVGDDETPIQILNGLKARFQQASDTKTALRVIADSIPDKLITKNLNAGVRFTLLEWINNMAPGEKAKDDIVELLDQEIEFATSDTILDTKPTGVLEAKAAPSGDLEVKSNQHEPDNEATALEPDDKAAPTWPSWGLDTKGEPDRDKQDAKATAPVPPDLEEKLGASGTKNIADLSQALSKPNKEVVKYKLLASMHSEYKGETEDSTRFVLEKVIANLIKIGYHSWKPEKKIAELKKLSWMGWNDGEIEAFVGGEGAKVTYLDEKSRDDYELKGGNPLVQWDPETKSDKPYDTSQMKSVFKDTHGIFVMDPNGKIYANAHRIGRFHHSSFLAGGDTASAGTMMVKQGTLKEMSTKTGHYAHEAKKEDGKKATPQAERKALDKRKDHLYQILSELKERGVALAPVPLFDWNRKIIHKSAADFLTLWEHEKK